MGNARKKTSSDKPSGAERRAMTWHKRWHKHLRVDSWWNCRECVTANPFDAAARRAAVTDIYARIADSIASARLPEPKQHEGWLHDDA